MLSTRFVNYDPLVSDAACHTRALYLAFLAKKEKNEKTPLSKDESTYLENCKILTDSRARNTDNFDLITEEATNADSVPDEQVSQPPSLNKKKTYLSKKKSMVATSTLAYLQTACSELQLYANPEIFTFDIRTDSQRIPVLPLYISAKMMLHLAAKHSYPLVVNLKRISLQEKSFLLDGAVSLVYSFNQEKKQFSPQEAKGDEEAIAIDMVSCLVKNTEEETAGFLASPIFQTFLEVFKQEDLATLVMICAVGHKQYPKSAEKLRSKEQDPVLDTPFIEEKMDEKAAFQTSLNECSKSDYNKLYSLANRYGFFRKDLNYVSLAENNTKIVRTKTSIPLYIDHVYASTINECKNKTAKLLEKASPLIAPLEEDSVIYNKGIKKQ